MSRNRSTVFCLKVVPYRWTTCIQFRQISWQAFVLFSNIYICTVIARLSPLFDKVCKAPLSKPFNFNLQASFVFKDNLCSLFSISSL